MEQTSNRIASIIVVTCGTNHYLEACLDSIKEQTHSNLETIVIDSRENNLTYCDALNLGIRKSEGDFILCLNDDVVLDKRFIEEALKGFDIGERIGMVSGKVLRSNRETIDSTGLFLSLCRTAKERGYGFKDKGQFERQGYIFGVNGAVAFYRKEMLEEIKEGKDHFDPDFHFFYEDLDIAWRAKRYGWRGYYIPSAIAYHIRGGTARLKSGINKSYARRYLSDDLHLDLIKNRYLTLIKNESSLDFLLHLPFIFLYDFAVWSYILFFRPQLARKSFLKAKYLKNSLNKRRFSVDKLKFKKFLKN